MKRKLLLAALYVVGALGFNANAQKDVTNDYLKNADFSSGTPVDGSVEGYGKNMETNGNHLYGLQEVEGWKIKILKDADDADSKGVKYPGSAMAGGMFAYGASYKLNNKVEPPVSSKDNAEGNCLGFLAVWSCGGYYYQDVTLPAGKYNITVPAYCGLKGNQSGISYTGFIADNGTKYVKSIFIDENKWENLEIEFTLSEETKGQIALGYQSTGNGSDYNPHLFFDCVKLTYTISFEIYSSIVDAAKALQDKPMNKDVKSALDAAISQYGNLTANDEAQFEAAVEALGTATSAANASIKNYEDALAILNAAESNSLDKDGQAAYAADETIAAIQAAYTAGTLEAVTEEQKTASEQAFQAAIRAQGAGADMTLAINNWDFLNCQNDKFPGWTIQATPSGTAKVKTATQVEFWTTSATRSFDFYQTVSNLPVGKYTIQAAMWYSKDGQANDKIDGSAGVYGASSGNEVFKGVTTECTNTGCVTETTDEISVYDGTLRLGVKNDGTMGARWFGVDWIKLTYVEPIELAAETEYAALNAAIAAAEEHTLGFEAGEYAPYNNVEVVTLLATAKALNQEADNAKKYVEKLTQSINEAKWSEANTEEINAFYDGTLKETIENTKSGEVTTPAGWTSSENMRLILKNTETYPGLEYATDKSAIFTWSGGVTYGEQTGYEMPLKQAVYKLTFKATGWNNEDVSAITVSVKNGEKGLESKALAVPTTDIIGKADGRPAGFTDYEVLFLASEAGNYVFSVKSGNNFVLTDITLFKAVDPSVEVAVSAAGYVTFSSELPLDLSGIEGGKAYIATSEAEKGTIKLVEQTGKVAAGTGLVIAAEVGEEESVTVTIPVAVEGTDLSNNNYLIATDGKEVEEGNYVLAATKETYEDVGFYVLNKAEIIETGKAYLSADAVPTDRPAKLRIVFGDENATAIEAVATEAETDGVLYNVAGQQVGKDYKGIVIDKNGKKYLNK